MPKNIREEDKLLHDSLDWFFKNVDTTDKIIAKKARTHYDRINKFLIEVAPVNTKRIHIAHEERRKIIFRMVADGASPNQVASVLKITRSSLNDWLKRNKISPWKPKTEWKPEMDAELLRLWNQNETAWNISKKMRLSDSVIRTRLRKLINLPAKADKL